MFENTDISKLWDPFCQKGIVQIRLSKSDLQPLTFKTAVVILGMSD